MIVNDSSSFQRNGVLRFKAYRAASELSRLSKRRETPRGPLLMHKGKGAVTPFPSIICCGDARTPQLCWEK